jgi:hypothetical protein
MYVTSSLLQHEQSRAPDKEPVDTGTRCANANRVHIEKSGKRQSKFEAGNAQAHPYRLKCYSARISATLKLVYGSIQLSYSD